MISNLSKSNRYNTIAGVSDTNSIIIERIPFENRDYPVHHSKNLSENSLTYRILSAQRVLGGVDEAIYQQKSQS